MEFLIPFLADYVIWMAIVAVPLVWLSDRRTAYFAIVATGIAWLVGSVIKDFFYFPRPFIVSGLPPAIPFRLDGSFPSTHTAIAVAIAAVIYARYRQAGISLIIVACLVAVGRVISGIHSVVDVIGGAGIGLVSAFISTKIKIPRRILPF